MRWCTLSVFLATVCSCTTKDTPPSRPKSAELLSAPSDSAEIDAKASGDARATGEAHAGSGTNAADANALRGGPSANADAGAPEALRAGADAPGASRSDPRCPQGMVLIPPATFMMGTTLDDPNDRMHQVTITKPYCIDRTPVTVAEYRNCVEAKACTAPHKPMFYNYERPGRDDHPVNGIEWSQAHVYCRWANKRLPTDAEWELAARGTDGRRYPWGNEEPDDTRLHWSNSEDRDGTAPVGSHPAGASPYGVLEMFGNVSQWVADWDSNHPAGHQVDPRGPAKGEVRVLRGLAFDARRGELHVGSRYARPSDVHSSTTSVRCAR